MGGVTAQTLRHVELLLEVPWTVRLSERLGFPVGQEGVQIRIPNPASFIAQKLLVLKERAPEKQPKDLLYIHDTLTLFSEKLDELRVSWTLVQQRQHPKISSKLQARFGAVNDLVRAAVRIAEQTGRPSPPTPERFVGLCREGTRAVFAPPTPSPSRT